MFKSRFILSALTVSGCAILLTACPLQGADPIVGDPLTYTVTNDYKPDPEAFIEPEDIICLGGLKAKFMTGKTVLVESPIVQHGEPSFRKELENPEGFGKGSPLKIEGWCYNIDGSQQGYILYENRMSGGPLAFGVAVVGLKVDENCLDPSSAFGEPPCISTNLFGK